MSYVVRALCTSDAAPGLWLAGVPVTLVDPARELDAQVEALAEAADLGVLLVEDTLYDRLSPDREKHRPLPMVVPFPSPKWSAEEDRDYVLEMLRRAIGYRVRLK